MIKLITDELFTDLAHKFVLWSQFYKNLSMTIDKLKSNIDSLSTFIQSKNLGQLQYNYNDMDEVWVVFNLVVCLERAIFCVMTYDTCVHNYIKGVVFNIRSVPTYVTGIRKVNVPLSNRTKLLLILDICNNLKKGICALE